MRNLNAISVHVLLKCCITLIPQSDGDLGKSVIKVGRRAEKEITDAYRCPSRMKDLSPLPRPVEVLLPPRAIAMADKTALLPPRENKLSMRL